MTAVSVAALVEQIQALLPPSSLADFSRWASRCAEPTRLVEEPQRLGWLTDFQCTALLAGNGSDLLLGPYVLLDLLGQGATGRVYQARDTVGNRLVALKVIGPEALRSPRAVERLSARGSGNDPTRPPQHRRRP